MLILAKWLHVYKCIASALHGGGLVPFGMMSAMSRKTLEALLKERGWNYERLAVEIGVRGTTVYRWLTGKSEPSPIARGLLKDKLGYEW